MRSSSLALLLVAGSSLLLSTPAFASITPWVEEGDPACTSPATSWTWFDLSFDEVNLTVCNDDTYLYVRMATISDDEWFMWDNHISFLFDADRDGALTTDDVAVTHGMYYGVFRSEWATMTSAVPFVATTTESDPRIEVDWSQNYFIDPYSAASYRIALADLGVQTGQYLDTTIIVGPVNRDADFIYLSGYSSVPDPLDVGGIQIPVYPFVDSDGDGLLDPDDACPAEDATGWDMDADGCLDDTDGDGATDDADVCPGGDDFYDADADFAPDDCDICLDDALNDQDGDGLCTADDPCPLEYGVEICGDTSTCPDPQDDDTIDSDGDGLADCHDSCPLDAENDGDGDGLCESEDNCEGVANGDQADADDDGIGNVCEPDSDGDGAVDDLDNCPLVANASQTDADNDGTGDACDSDGDNDGVANGSDTCPGTPSGTAVLPNGCSAAQTCPPTSSWKNHGSYMGCVSGVAGALAGSGAITQAQQSALATAAAHSNVGKKN